MDYAATAPPDARPRTRLSFFVYAGGSVDAARAGRLARVAGGLVVGRRSGTRIASAVRDDGFSGPLMADPALYERLVNADEDAGDGTLFGDRDETWADIQTALHVTAHLSPSVYIPAGRYDVLEQVPDDGRRFCDGLNGRPAYVVLPVHSTWLSRHYDRLVTSAGSCGHPVALVLGEKYNPLESVPKIHGLLQFLDRVPGTLLLRTDIACVGAVAHNVAGAAYGTTGTVRHVWPPDERNPSRGGPRGVSTVLAPALLRHVPIDKLEQLPSVDGALDCRVESCDVASVDRLTRPQYSDVDRMAHDLHAVRDLAEKVMDCADPAREWRAMCDRAENLHERLSGPGMVRLAMPRYLSAWLRVSRLAAHEA